MTTRLGRAMALAMILAAASGCGRGLTVSLSSTPSQAGPGTPVDWTVSVRNNSNCTTVNVPIPLPTPLPSQGGAFAIFVGGVPDASRDEAVAVCQQFLNRPTGCSDLDCVGPILEEALGAASAERVMAGVRGFAEAARSGAQQPLPAGTCTTIANDSSGFAAVCAFDPLDPDETDTAMFSDTIQGSGVTSLLALALAPAEGADCRPGREVGTDQWLLGGCFPAQTTAAAPALSPAAIGAALLLLVGAGLFGLNRRRG